MKLRLWPLLWMVYEPLRNVGVRPQPAVVAADADGPEIAVATIAPAAVRATAPSVANQRARTGRVSGIFTAVTPCSWSDGQLRTAAERPCASRSPLPAGPASHRARRCGLIPLRLARQGQQTRPVGEQSVVAAGVGGASLVEQLQVAGVDGHRLVRVATDQIAVADVVGPRRAAVCLAGEGIALGRCLRGPRTAQTGGGERAEVAPVRPDRLHEHEVLVLALDLVDL